MRGSPDYRLATLFAVLASIYPAPLPAQTVGELALNAGLAGGLGANGRAAAAVSASFSFVARDFFTLGPEMQYVSGDQGMMGYAGVVRMRFKSTGLRPYLVGGLGAYAWREPFREATLFSGSIGVGAHLGTRRAPTMFAIEARYHENLQRYLAGENFTFFTLTGGMRFRW